MQRLREELEVQLTKVRDLHSQEMCRQRDGLPSGSQSVISSMQPQAAPASQSVDSMNLLLKDQHIREIEARLNTLNQDNELLRA